MFDFLFPKEWSTLKKLIWLKASVLIGAVYSTFTGSIARFLSPSSKPVKSIVCNIEPVQDLHGYDNPWPAGGGKNILNPNKRTEGVQNIYYYQADGIVLNAGTYTLSISGENAAGLYIRKKEDLSTIAVKYNDVALTFTLAEDTNVYIDIYYSAAPSDISAIKCQLELGSTATAWTPYSNICPITGHTGLNVYGESEYDPTADPKVAVTWQSEAGTVYAGYLSIDKDGNVTLTGVAELEVFDTMLDENTIGSQINFFSKTGGNATALSNVTRISLAVRTYVDQAKYNRISTSYSDKICNIAPHYFSYASDTTHWYRNTILYLFLPTSLVGSTAESVFNYLVSIKDTTPLSVWLPLATPVTYTLSSVTVPSTVQGENNWWHDANGNITIEAIGTPISSDEPDALQSLNILLGGAYTPRANFSEPTDEQALNIIMGGSR